MSSPVEASYLENRSIDPELEEFGKKLQEARERDRLNQLKKGLSQEQEDLQMGASRAAGHRLGRDFAVGMFDLAKATGEAALDVGTAAANATGLPQAASATKQAAAGVKDPELQELPDQDLSDLFPDFMKSATELRNQAAEGSDEVDVFMQKAFQFTVPMLGWMKAVKVGEGATLIDKLGRVVAADFAANLHAWEHNEARFGDFLRMLAPDNELIARFTDNVVSDPDDTEMEGRWKNAVDSFQFGALLYGAGKVIKLIRHGTPAMLQQIGQGPVGMAAQRGAIDFGPMIPGKMRFANYLTGEVPAAKPRSQTNLQVARDLEKEARTFWKGEWKDTPENRVLLAQQMADEVQASLKLDPKKAEWYAEDLAEAKRSVAELHPEILTDEFSGNVFDLMTALLSNGKKVEWNAETALKTYEKFKKTGRIQRVAGTGKEIDAINAGLVRAQKMIDKLGPDEFVRFLHTDFTPKQLQDMGYKVSGELMDEPLKGSAVFGPKVGGGFFQNLRSNWDPTTFDRWWMRSWGRLTGRLQKSRDTTLLAGQRESFAEKVRSNRKLLERHGIDVEKALSSNRELYRLAGKLHGAFAKGSYKKKTPLNNAARNLDKTLRDLIDAPKSGGQRRQMRQVMALVREELAQRGVKLKPAQIQALEWFFEKGLYKKGGAREVSGADTYGKAFARAVAKRTGRSGSAGGSRGSGGGAGVRGTAGDVGGGGGAGGQQGSGLPAKTSETGLTVSWGGKTYPVESVEDAAAKWDEFRMEAQRAGGGGSSELGGIPIQVKDGSGQVVARIAYNGRIIPADSQKLADQILSRPGMDDAVRQDSLKNREKILAGAAETEAKQELGKILDDYEYGNDTTRDVLDKVEGLLDDELLEDDVLSEAAKAYRKELVEDFEVYAGRNDVEPYEDAFMDAVRRVAGRNTEREFKTVAHAFAEFSDDRSHGDEALAEAARELYDKFAKRQGAVDEYVAEVEELAKKIQKELDGA